MTLEELFAKEGFEPSFKSRYELNWANYKKGYTFNVMFNLKDKTYKYEKLSVFESEELIPNKNLQKAIDIQIQELGW